MSLDRAHEGGNPGIRPAGFTLIEVLVALAILAVALAAAARAAALGVDATDTLRTRLLADWVAQDRLADLHARNEWPPIGARSGTAAQAGHTFAWREETSATPNPAFRRIEITVHAAPDDAHVLRRLVGYVARPS